jgi:hypothetical protein
MTPPPFQATRFERLQRQLADLLFAGLRGSWRRRSLVLLALLVGFYGAQNLTALWLERIGLRPVVALVVLLLVGVGGASAHAAGGGAASSGVVAAR